MMDTMTDFVMGFMQVTFYIVFLLTEIVELL